MAKPETFFIQMETLIPTMLWLLQEDLISKNTYVMKGGLNEWFNTVMNSSFTGERISARENALFETRTRAKKMFTEMNSLPDSLKVKFIQTKHIDCKKT